MIELIPAIDIIDGRCVRLSQGDYNSSKEYSSNPLEIAKAFEGVGVNRLHVVDLDGAKSSHVVNTKVLEQLCSHTNLTIDFGGGIKSQEDLHMVFDAGASMVTIGSMAVTFPDKLLSWIAEYGSERFIIGADLKGGKLSIHGWLEESDENLYDFLSKYINVGARKVLCTDISKDGMLNGPSTDLYKEILEHFPTLHLIASGGVSKMEDIKWLDSCGVPAVVFGKAFYEGRISLEEIGRFLHSRPCLSHST